MTASRWFRILPVAAILCGTFALQAKVEPAKIFSDNAVLQRGMDVPVWGKANPGEVVTVNFAGQSVSATAGNDGKWMVKLSPMEASKENRSMEITGKDNTVTVKNVLVGEVWIASGQSNMEWSLNNHKNASGNGKDIVKQTNYPTIRFVKVERKFSETPSPDEPVVWHQAVAGDPLLYSSAVAFFFAKELVDELDVPVGILGAYWGGTRIEPWTAPEGFAAVPELANISRRVNSKIPGTPEFQQINSKAAADYKAWLAQYEKAVANNERLPLPPAIPDSLKPYQNQQEPTVLYNQMLYRFIPYAVRGAIWYQGEANVAEGMLYRHKMQALLDGWKKVFGNPELKFYFAQLAPFTYGNPAMLPYLWEAQQAFADAEKDAGMAVISDAVHNVRDIHPTDKEIVGKRLAYLALNRDYGKAAIKADSPKLADAKVDGRNFVLDFDHVESWKTLDGKPIGYFEVAGYDGVYHPAEAKIQGRHLIVSSDKVTEPMNIRYKWSQTAEGKLTNEAGLLLGAFRKEHTPTLEEQLAFFRQNYTLVYEYDLLSGSGFGDKTRVNYIVDNSSEVKGKISRVAYIAVLEDKDGNTTYVSVGMDGFTNRAAELGVPVRSVGRIFQERVRNLSVYSNVKGLLTGFIPEGNIEFWPNNYSSRNEAKIPGASDGTNDFGDRPDPGTPIGYGSMQIHNFAGKQTIFAYNKFDAGPNSDLGIGNNPGQHPDWTFTGSAKNYRKATLYVFAKEEARSDGSEIMPEVTALVPEAASMKLIYKYNLRSGSGFGDRTRVNYEFDNSDVIGGGIKRVAYLMKLVKNGESSWVYVALDPFTQEAAKLGVPVKSTGAKFQQIVKNLEVKSNVAGVKTGMFEDGNIEFWPNNYSQRNAADVPGASNDTFDFGDVFNTDKEVGYGSMQVHNYREKQTVFAYNKFDSGPKADAGIGNAPGKNTDWTFTGNLGNYSEGTLYVLVETE